MYVCLHRASSWLLAVRCHAALAAATLFTGCALSRLRSQPLAKALIIPSTGAKLFSTFDAERLTAAFPL
jgi:hypothetical protein